MTFGRSPFTRVVSPSLLTLFVVRLSEEIQYVNLLWLFLCSLLRPVYFLDPSIYPLQLCMLLHVILNVLLYYLIKLNEDQLPQTSWLQRFEFLGVHVVDLRVFQTFWGGGDRPGTIVSLPAWGDSRSWSAFSEENNLNSSGQTEAGFQDVIRLLRQDKAVSPWLAAAARVVPLLMTQLAGEGRPAWEEREREQGRDYPSTPPYTLPKSNLKLCSCAGRGTGRRKRHKVGGGFLYMRDTTEVAHRHFLHFWKSKIS